MKNLLKILTLLLVIGCSCKDFLKVDEFNPNSASTVPANLILPAALNTTARNITLPDRLEFIYIWYGCWSVNISYSQPVYLTQYSLLNASYQNHWNESYLNGENYDYIEKNTTDPASAYFNAIAKIMKVYVFQSLVDVYGNVPYSEAFKADQGVLKPVYDDQKVIYEDLVVKLDEAINIITDAPADATEVGSGDIMFHGNMELWKKFANTLKLRLLINQSDMTGRESYISTALATTASVGFLGAGEGAMVNPGYLQSETKMNPFWEACYKQDGSKQADALSYWAAGQDACDFLTNNNDPRKLRFFAPYSDDNIQGNYFGAPVLQNSNVTSTLGPGLLQGYNMSAPLLTDFESLFLQAEAAERGFIPGDPKTLYESAVTQSILYLGGTEGTFAAAATYLAQAGKPLVNWDLASNKIQIIITQKWCALNGISALPLWTDYRRTGYPDFIHWSADPAKKNPTPPVRLLYPQTEISTNNDNVVAQGNLDYFTSKLFWQNR